MAPFTAMIIIIAIIVPWPQEAQGQGEMSALIKVTAARRKPHIEIFEDY